jgi:Gas vesicle protein K
MSEAILSLDSSAVDTAMRQLFHDKIANGRGDATLALDPDRVEHDIARLVLTLMEALRKLLEMQAVRRMQAGRLTEDEEERLGETLMRAESRISELAESFGLSPTDLKLDLGPLGRLM